MLLNIDNQISDALIDWTINMRDFTETSSQSDDTSDTTYIEQLVWETHQRLQSESVMCWTSHKLNNQF